MEEARASTSSQHNTGLGAGAARNFEKCKKCRHDGKKCLPQPRLVGQRCYRCSRIGVPCSLPERVVRTRRRSSVAGIASGVLVAGGGGGEGGGEVPSTTSASGGTMQAPTAWLGQGANYGHVSHMSATITTSQRLHKRCILDLKNSLKSELAPDHSMVSHSYHLSQELDWSLRSQIDSLQDHQLYGTPASQPQQGLAAQSVDSASGDFKTHLCSVNILTQSRPLLLQPQGHVRNSVNELPDDYYRFTESAVTELMASLPNQNGINWAAPYHRQYTATMRTGPPFPASHIAYWNLDRNAAFRLWQSTAGQRPPIDVLGRTFPHIVAEAGDSLLLAQMGYWELLGVESDARGLNLLDLGVIGDSAAVVSMLIDQDIVPRPYNRAVQRAISIGNHSIATHHLVQHLHRDNTGEIDFLTTLAGEHRLIELQHLLSAVPAQAHGPQHALDSLDALRFNLGSDNTIIPEDPYDFEGLQDLSTIPGDASVPDLWPDSSQMTIESFQSEQDTGSFDSRYGGQFYPP